ncbi:MAG: glycosyltransferase family 4 protein [Chloroflexi bacterium]|nr:glycosyltransferase family 4 protein [Chloroflexota bacterium]
MSAPIHAGIIQRVLTEYRAPFFDLLAQRFSRGASLFSGQPRPAESIAQASGLRHAHWTLGHNRHLFSGGAYLCWQSGLLTWLRSADPDVLIVEANPRYLRTPAAIRWMKNRARPVIGWGLGAPAAPGRLAALRRWWRTRWVRQFDALITYSQQGAQEYQALGFPANRVFVAANAVTPRPQNPPPSRPEKAAAQDLNLLFVGRLQERKRIDSLLRAVAALPPHQRPSLSIVGDGPARPALQALAAEVLPAARFLGALHGAELDAQFDAADLFVLPGTGGLAVQQAMAHALPVIVAEADGTQADLVRPQNGWLVPPGDLPALSACLQNALSDPRRLREMGLHSYRIVHDEINLEKMVDVFVQAVETVMEG